MGYNRIRGSVPTIMALLFVDGFDHYDDTRLVLKWDAKGGVGVTTPTVVAGVGRCATQAVGLYDSFNYIQKSFPGGPASTFSAGVAYNPTNGTIVAPNIIIGFKTNTHILCGVAVSSTQQLFAFTGNSEGSVQVLGYAATPIRSGVFQYVEVHVDGISDTTGNIAVYLNGVQEINLTNVETSGVTLNGVSYDHAEAFTLGSRATYVRTDYLGVIYFDDFYFTDSTGLYNTGILGDVHIEELTPNADGFYQDWTALLAGSHYVEVDEIPPDDDASYVHGSVVGNKDTYTYPSITPTTGTVLACVVNFYCTKVTSGSRAVRAITRLGGVDGSGTEFLVGNAYAIHQSIAERDPNDDAWTISNVNASEAGPEITF